MSTLRVLSLAVVLALAACAGAPPAPTPGTPEANAQARARIHTELAAGYYTRGQHDIALEELNAALRDDPNYAGAFGMLGLVYAELREDAKAEASFQHAIQINPQDPELRNNFGWFLCQRGKEPQSLGQFEMAVGNPLYRTPDMALVNAGRCAAKIGDRKGAEAFLQRALNVAPNNATAQVLLANLAYKAGDYELARSRVRPLSTGAAATPEALFLGLCVEKKLGDRAAETSFAYQLKQRYPNAPETRLADAGSCE